MLGVGQIFEWYSEGVLEDDEEVAVLHGPAEMGYKPLTDAMVNIRATVARGLEQGIITEMFSSKFIKKAKSLFYKLRTYEVILDNFEGTADLSAAAGEFRKWLATERVDLARKMHQ